jgi:hypothetical protein
MIRTAATNSGHDNDPAAARHSARGAAHPDAEVRQYLAGIPPQPNALHEFFPDGNPDALDLLNRCGVLLRGTAGVLRGTAGVLLRGYCGVLRGCRRTRRDATRRLGLQQATAARAPM